MKKTTIFAVSLIAAMGLTAFGQNKDEDRVRNAGQVISEIMNIPDDIPQSVIDKADCVVVLPSVLKAAFIVGGSYGRGVMTCRGGRDFRGPWGAPTMMALEGAKLWLPTGRTGDRFRFAADEPEIGFLDP